MGYGSPQGDIHADRVVEFETEVMAIPQYDPENPMMISQGPSVCIFNKEDSGEVLASWLFLQYLLTNDVQIAYSQTEGYVPVTAKAQNTPEYVDYLSREGEDGDLYYAVKLKATKIALEYTDKSFVTPVFNGSASLRNAAGQLIEEVAKGTRRHKTVDDAFIENLYGEMTSLYRLDGIGGGQSGRAELGELPATSVMLLGAIGAAWVFIGIYALIGYLKKRKNQGNT
jgi:multiple sugar transport system substrate-binding protein